VQGGNMGASGFRVYALSQGEKIYITEYIHASKARAIHREIQLQLNNT
jgi:hypothetical protein